MGEIRARVFGGTTSPVIRDALLASVLDETNFCTGDAEERFEIRRLEVAIHFPGAVVGEEI